MLCFILILENLLYEYIINQILITKIKEELNLKIVNI